MKKAEAKREIRDGFINVDVRAGNVLCMIDMRIHDTVEQAIANGGMAVPIKYAVTVKEEKK